MKKLLKFILLIVIVAAGIFIYSGYSKYKSALEEMPLSEKVSQIQNTENYTSIENIPETFIQAIVSVEDRRFYKHNGFDIIGTGRAILTDIKNMALVEGGSTITQQLAKNMYFPLDNSPSRKIAEIFAAFKIEREYSKEDILELYCNIVYYGKGCYNIYDAFHKYFGKDPQNMTDYECTLLAGMPNAPSVYSENSDLAAKRQKKVLKSMVRSEYISEDEMNEILAQS